MPLPMPLLSRRRSRSSMFCTGARTCRRMLRTCTGRRMLTSTSRRRRHRNPQQRILCILRIINPILHIPKRVIRIPTRQLPRPYGRGVPHHDSAEVRLPLNVGYDGVDFREGDVS
jgi:hypothetical protein